MRQRGVAPDGRVMAHLGPTNTGKTHLAVERLLEHPTGVIGFPLRLLARENYDKLVRLRGGDAVALVTGEEKIVPASARWFVCTVEAMPLERRFHFVAVDEIQLCADRERGHVFTDRLLHARGLDETMFLGADTIRPLLRRLLPATELEARPRFSVLSHTGPKKLARLPPRSAVVAFSVNDVYAIADELRRHKGGTAVVLGALSPRTRNAQVQMYQQGEVDYLVATDAIGMGLNLDVEHVAFAALAKFDGEDRRELTAAELAQIAGRAGRFMTDGSFGTTEHAPLLDPGVIDQIVNHRFAPLQALVWRNSDLDFASVEALIASLEAPSPHADLTKGRLADDLRALRLLASTPSLRQRIRGSSDVQLLWEVCQVPDFRKISAEEHAQIVADLLFRLQGSGHLARGYVEDHLARLNRPDGNVEDLMARLAHVRTWSYVAFRSGWLEDPEEARETARAAEDRLSDALHERLQRRFVDRLASAMRRRSHAGEALETTLGREGEVIVEGAALGRLQGFRFEAGGETRDEQQRLSKAAARGLKQHIAMRAAALCADPDPSFALSANGRITWRGDEMARLTRGNAPLTPDVELLPSPLLEPGGRQQVRERVAAFVARHVRERLAPLVSLIEAQLDGPARGLAYQLGTSLGAVPRSDVARLLDTLTQDDRRRLHGRGVRLGWRHVFLPSLLKPATTTTCAALFTAHHALLAPPSLPPGGAVSFAVESEAPAAFWLACGYLPIGAHAFRIDMLDRVAVELKRLGHLHRGEGFDVPAAVLSWLGAPAAVLADVLDWCGFVLAGDRLCRAAPRRRPPKPRAHRNPHRGALGTLADLGTLTPPTHEVPRPARR